MFSIFKDYLISNQKMSSSACEEEILFGIASLSPSLSLQLVPPELLHTSDPIILEINPIPGPTSPDIQSSSSTHTQPISSFHKTRHSLPIHLLIF